MKTESRETRRGNRVFKKTLKSKNWMFLKTVNGKRYYFPVGKVLSDAKQSADEIDAYSLFNSIEDTVTKFRPNGRRVFGENKKVPTVGEIIERFTLLAPADLGVTDTTIAMYARSIRVMCSRGLPGRDPDKVHLSDINPTVVSAWKRSYIEGVSDQEKLKSVKRSLNSYLTGIKGLFSSRALDLYHNWDVSASEALLALRPYPRVKKTYRLPPVDLLTRTFDLLHSLEPNPDHYVVLALALHFGLRRKELFNARREWVSFKDGKASVAVFTEKDFLVKAGEDGYAQGSEKIGRKILELSTGFDYLVANRYIRSALDPVVKSLREIGWDRGMPLHECRKLYGSYIASTENLYVAQKNLRHASPMTTNDFYTDLVKGPEVLGLWAA
jgi:integrase